MLATTGEMQLSEWWLGIAKGYGCTDQCRIVRGAYDPLAMTTKIWHVTENAPQERISYTISDVIAASSSDTTATYAEAVRALCALAHPQPQYGVTETNPDVGFRNTNSTLLYNVASNTTGANANPNVVWNDLTMSGTGAVPKITYADSSGGTAQVDPEEWRKLYGQFLLADSQAYPAYLYPPPQKKQEGKAISFRKITDINLEYTAILQSGFNEESVDPVLRGALRAMQGVGCGEGHGISIAYTGDWKVRKVTHVDAAGMYSQELAPDIWWGTQGQARGEWLTGLVSNVCYISHKTQPEQAVSVARPRLRDIVVTEAPPDLARRRRRLGI